MLTIHCALLHVPRHRAAGYSQKLSTRPDLNSGEACTAEKREPRELARAVEENFAFFVIKPKALNLGELARPIGFEIFDPWFIVWLCAPHGVRQPRSCKEGVCRSTSPFCDKTGMDHLVVNKLLPHCRTMLASESAVVRCVDLPAEGAQARAIVPKAS